MLGECQELMSQGMNEHTICRFGTQRGLHGLQLRKAGFFHIQSPCNQARVCIRIFEGDENDKDSGLRLGGLWRSER